MLGNCNMNKARTDLPLYSSPNHSFLYKEYEIFNMSVLLNKFCSLEIPVSVCGMCESGDWSLSTALLEHSRSKREHG